jgi:hypothetical protein
MTYGSNLPPQVQALQILQLAIMQRMTLRSRSINQIAPPSLPAMATARVARAILQRSLLILVLQAMCFMLASVDTTPRLVLARLQSFSQHQVLVALELRALAMSFMQVSVATMQFAAQTSATSTQSAVKLDGIKVASISQSNYAVTILAQWLLVHQPIIVPQPQV